MKRNFFPELYHVIQAQHSEARTPEEIGLLYDISNIKSPVRKVKKKRVKASREKPPQLKGTELKDVKEDKYGSVSLRDVGLDTGYSFSQTEGGQVELIETLTGSDQKE